MTKQSQQDCRAPSGLAMARPENDADGRVQQPTGFTLIEVMVALAIVAISLVVLLGLRNRDIQLEEEAIRITEATLFAKERMTEVSLEAFPPLGEREGDYPGTPYQWRQVVSTTPFDGVRDVRISVSWPDKDPGVTLVTYAFQSK